MTEAVRFPFTFELTSLHAVKI